MLKRLERLATELLAKNPWWEYRHDRYTQPNGEVGEYYYVHTPGSVMVIPVTAEGKLVLVKQYRYLNGNESIEFVGGGVKEGLAPETAAADELREETGYEAETLTNIGFFNPMNGVTDELCTVFIAHGLKQFTATPDTTEEFEMFELTFDECREAIRTGSIWDGMTLAAFSLFERH